MVAMASRTMETRIKAVSTILLAAVALFGVCVKPNSLGPAKPAVDDPLSPNPPAAASATESQRRSNLRQLQLVAQEVVGNSTSEGGVDGSTESNTTSEALGTGDAVADADATLGGGFLSNAATGLLGQPDGTVGSSSSSLSLGGNAVASSTGEEGGVSSLGGAIGSAGGTTSSGLLSMVLPMLGQNGSVDVTTKGTKGTGEDMALELSPAFNLFGSSFALQDTFTNGAALAWSNMVSEGGETYGNGTGFFQSESEADVDATGMNATSTTDGSSLINGNATAVVEGGAPPVLPGDTPNFVNATATGFANASGTTSGFGTMINNATGNFLGMTFGVP